jgi:hypothetical protein
MANPAILCLLATLALFSGCLEADGSASTADSPQQDPVDHAPTVEEADGAAAEVPNELPACPPGGQSNYGTWIQAGDDYIVSPYASNIVVYYRESNGCNGLQAESEWAHNPDTKVAEVPYPIPSAPPTPAVDDGAGAKDGCKPHTSNTGSITWTQVGDLYIIAPYDNQLLVVYKESNGIRGIQTERQCPSNPDAKVAEAPYPLLDGAVPSAKA